MILWFLSREVGKNGASQLPALLSRHALSVGLQLAGRQASASLPKEVLAILVKGVEAGEVERAQIVKMLLAQDINWDKTALGGQVTTSQICILHSNIADLTGWRADGKSRC